MKQLHIRPAHLVFLTLLFCGLVACERPQTATPHGEKIMVVASIFPLADFVRNVGCERVEVRTLLPPAASPHLYSPAPRDLARAEGAQLFVKIGLGFEFWAEGLARAGADKGLVEIETSEGVELLQETGYGHDQIVANPHIWLDPVIAGKQIRRIEQALIEIDPSHRTAYQTHAAAYLKQLNKLDQEIRQAVASFKQKSFIAFHPSWAYFARAYGLEEAGVIEVSPGRKPTPGEIIAIVRKIRESEVRVIFAEPQSNPKAAHVIASETNAKVLFLDPIGTPEQEDRSTYLKLMRYNLAVMQEAMGHP